MSRDTRAIAEQVIGMAGARGIRIPLDLAYDIISRIPPPPMLEREREETRKAARVDLLSELIQVAKNEAASLNKTRYSMPGISWREAIHQETALERMAEWLEERQRKEG